MAALLALACCRAFGANDGEVNALLDANGCSNCHARAEQIVGPSFADVAEKYQNVPGAQEALVVKVRRGGAGVWGQVAMPPNPNVSDSDLRKILDWIRSLLPDATHSLP